MSCMYTVFIHISSHSYFENRENGTEQKSPVVKGMWIVHKFGTVMPMGGNRRVGEKRETRRKGEGDQPKNWEVL